MIDFLLAHWLVETFLVVLVVAFTSIVRWVADEIGTLERRLDQHSSSIDWQEKKCREQRDELRSLGHHLGLEYQREYSYSKWNEVKKEQK